MPVRGRFRRSLAIAGALLLFGVARQPARGDDKPAAAPVEAAFLTALERAKGLLAAGKPDEGMALVTQTLVEHAGQNYARAKRADLEDLVRRLSFRAECPPPDPATLVNGTLKRFTSKTGDLEIHYYVGKKDDFKVSNSGALVFPSRFCGPYTITVRGSNYPSTTASSPSIQVGMEEDPKTHLDQTWVALFGIPPYGEGSNNVWLPAKLIHYSGEQKEVVYEKETSLAKAGAPFRLEVKVTKSRVAATFNGKPMGGAPKADTIFGFALIDAKGWEEITIDGQVEPSWIQTKIDAVVDAKRHAFDATFKVRSHLPSWLYQAGAAPGPGAGAGPEPDAEAAALKLLNGLPEEVQAGYLDALARLSHEDAQGALEALEAIRGKGAPDALVAPIAAQAQMLLHAPTKALAEVEKALKAVPQDTAMLLLKGEILLRLGRDDEMAVALQAAASSPGATKEIFESAGLSLLFAGQPDAARAVTEQAARRGIRSPGLEAIGRVLVQAQNGPDWPKAFEWKSSNYQVVSDIDVNICKQASQVLEEALTIYRNRVRPLKAEKRRLYRVYLFSGQAGFERYMAGVSVLPGHVPGRAAGIYSPILKQLLIWNLSSREEMMRTVRHEGFHQYLDRVLPDPPVWLNEGMAVYYEGMTKVAGELKFDVTNRDYVHDLVENPPAPLAKYLAIKPHAFYDGGEHSYAQAWLLIHLLQHGSAKHKEILNTLLTRLATEDSDDVIPSVFDEKTMKQLDADLVRHLADLNKGG